jgi:hypothetical protein
MNLFKSKSFDEKEAPINIVVELLKEKSDVEINTLPKIKTITDEITRRRNNCDNTYIKTFNDIPKIFKSILDNKRFLLFDAGVNDNQRYVIFASDFQISCLKKSNVWLMDETFKSCPSEFEQMYSIQAYIYVKAFPCAFILIKNKKQENYSEIFKIIKDHVEKSPQYIITDFKNEF